MEASYASTSDNGVSSWALSLAHPVLATPAHAFVPDALISRERFVSFTPHGVNEDVATRFGADVPMLVMWLCSTWQWQMLCFYPSG